jgi:hypothetical protein
MRAATVRAVLVFRLAVAMSASLQMAECWHPISMATRCFQQEGASFHKDRSAGGSALGMLNAELEGRKGGSRPDTTSTGRKTALRMFRKLCALLRLKITTAAETESELKKRRNTMDDYNNPTSDAPYGQPEGGAGTAARMKLSEKAAEVKEKAADFGRRTVESIDGSRETTAGALDQTAAKLHSHVDQLSGAAHKAADRISGVAHGTADKLQAAADYIRETDLKAMREDIKDVVKRYPGPSLVVAAVLGFLVARSLRRD